MSDIQAIRVIATDPRLKPYISSKRLERVAKCCEHYQNADFFSARNLGNIAKRIQHTETTFSDNFIRKHPEQFERGLVNDPEIYEIAKVPDPKAQEAKKTFCAYIATAKNIIVQGIIDHGIIC